MTVHTATWKYGLTTLPDGTHPQKLVSFMEKPQNPSYTRRRNGYCELGFEVVSPKDLSAFEASVYKYAVIAYRNGSAVFNGQIVEHVETPDGFSVVCKDPYYNMSWRKQRKAKAYRAVQGWDASHVAWDLIEQQNALRHSWLGQGAINDTPLTEGVDRKYAVGVTISDSVEYLARVPDSFMFRIDAVDMDDGDPQLLAKFNAVKPYDVLETKANFEYGTGTLENVLDFTREALPLVTKANIVGEDSNTVVSAESASGSADYGLWEDDRGQVRIKNVKQLENIADDFIMANPRYAITIKPSPEAPRLFTTFDVHDSVRVVLRRRGTTLIKGCPVWKAVIKPDPDSGAELLDELVLVDEATG